MGAATEQTQQEPQTQQTWHSANQRYLMAALERVRLALERHVERRRATSAAASDESPDTAATIGRSAEDDGRSARRAATAL